MIDATDSPGAREERRERWPNGSGSMDGMGKVLPGNVMARGT